MYLCLYNSRRMELLADLEALQRVANTEDGVGEEMTEGKEVGASSVGVTIEGGEPAPFQAAAPADSSTAGDEVARNNVVLEKVATTQVQEEEANAGQVAVLQQKMQEIGTEEAALWQVHTSCYTAHIG